ncbi:MAG: hypothetical protein MR935_05680, partial [Agathobaculum sp.]|uniref:hypothetical protein n=1 Tax=Agathobaculum sp. TaxID=2048138 RepID=UPI002A815149
MAGQGGSKPIRVVDRLVKDYGGKAEDWKKQAGKITSSKYVSSAHLLCNVRYPVRMRTIPAVTLMSHLGTPNQVSQWGSGVDSGIT